jgi:hypothetical protein
MLYQVRTIKKSVIDGSLLGKLFAKEQPKSLFLYQKFKKRDFSKVLSGFLVLSGTKIWNIMVEDKQSDFGSSLVKNI